MLKTEPTTIDGVTFSTTQFPAMQSMELFARTAKTAGPLIETFEGADLQASVASLLPAFATAVAKIEPKAFAALSQALLFNTHAEFSENGSVKRIELTSEININQVFNGRLKTMFKVLLHVLKVNWADFVEGIAAPDPKTSQATSGA